MDYIDFKTVESEFVPHSIGISSVPFLKGNENAPARLGDLIRGMIDFVAFDDLTEALIVFPSLVAMQHRQMSTAQVYIGGADTADSVDMGNKLLERFNITQDNIFVVGLDPHVWDIPMADAWDAFDNKLYPLKSFNTLKAA